MNFDDDFFVYPKIKKLFCLRHSSHFYMASFFNCMIIDYKVIMSLQTGLIHYSSLHNKYEYE